MTFLFSNILCYRASFLLKKQRVLTALDAGTQKKREPTRARGGTLVSAAEQSTAILEKCSLREGEGMGSPLIVKYCVYLCVFVHQEVWLLEEFKIAEDSVTSNQ